MNADILLLGGVAIDCYYKIDRWPERAGDAFVLGEETHIGGCAVNMAVTIRNLGGQAYVLSCVGDDENGKNVTSYMKEHGLSLKYFEELKGRTGKCLIFVEPDGERTFLTCDGIEGTFTDTLKSKAENEDFGAVGITGYYLIREHGMKILDSVEILKNKGAKILFDPSPLVMSIDKDVLSRMLELCDVITPNANELSMMGGDELLMRLKNEGKTVFYKMGANGGRVINSEEEFEYSAQKCPVVDTTGAGDSFSGALLYSMVNGFDLKKSADIALKCAAKTVGISGPHGFFDLEGI